MNPTAYPLAWPVGWPKTETCKREHGRFNNSLEGALSNLQKQVRLLGGTGLILSSNYTLGSSNPKEPGVVSYFTWDKTAVAIPCDRWTRIEQNVQAIALTIEAMRGMERWGAKHMIRAMFTGFKQLPESSARPWWIVLGLKEYSDREAIDFAYRTLAKSRHPDAGGSHEAFIELQAAYEAASAETSGIRPV